MVFAAGVAGGVDAGAQDGRAFAEVGLGAVAG